MKGVQAMQNRVFVMNKHGKALMPCKPRKARILLRDSKAKVLKKRAFYHSTLIWFNWL